MNLSDLPEICTAKEAADALRWNKAGVLKACREGKLGHIRISENRVRIRKDHIIKFLEDNSCPAETKAPRSTYRKDRECWEIVEYIRGKRRRRATNLCSLKAAEEALVEIYACDTPQGEPETVGALMAFYITHHAPTTARPDNIEQLAGIIAPFWGNVKVPDINPALCKKYAAVRQAEFAKKQKKDKQRKLSAGTIRKEIEQVQAAINFGRENGLITIAPVFWKPDPPPSKSRWLTGKEAAALLRSARSLTAAKDYLPLFIIIGLYTSARSEAILSLRWPQVDFKAGLIDFRPGQRSSLKGRSVVPIPPRLMRELKKARKEGNEMGYVIHRNQKPIKRVKKGFAEAVRLAGLQSVTPHTLRHTAISWQVQKGTPLAKVAKWAGHSTSFMIERVYGHLVPEHLDEIAQSYGGKYIENVGAATGQ